ncbi:NAD(P)-binding protein [Trichodelitschia bisporula]|uniref:NAD(P)-binding protein n=1 Tax=Trichodelitschia bisporula TaxID=703511 RepID=A0A6G1HZR5_9PEZI|nr:NAD(P)-binding protein [Trichodelitschia bisporula]
MPPTHVLIPGGTRGIGAAISAAFLALHPSTHVTTLSRNPPSSSDPRLKHLAFDISAPTWSALLKSIPPPDVLVNAAGVTHASLLLRTEEDVLDAVLDTNLRGTMVACKEVGKAMVSAGRGRGAGRGCIVNVSSLLGVRGGRGAAVYAASKAGVIGLTRALALELGPSGVRVNCIVPGYVETRMTADMGPETKKGILSKIPLGRFGRPEEIAEAAVFLATNQYANNCVINLDGGLSAGI